MCNERNSFQIRAYFYKEITIKMSVSRLFQRTLHDFLKIAFYGTEKRTLGER
jgi:hypothetical protein